MTLNDAIDANWRYLVSQKGSMSLHLTLFDLRYVLPLPPLSSAKNTMWPKMITQTFLLFGNSFPNCTGHLVHGACWQALFCVIRVPAHGTSVNALITQKNSLGITFPIACTSVPQKNCFRIVYLIILGLTVNINILSGTVSRANETRPWSKRDPAPRTNRDCPWDKPAVFWLIV